MAAGKMKTGQGWPTAFRMDERLKVMMGKGTAWRECLSKSLDMGACLGKSQEGRIREI